MIPSVHRCSFCYEHGYHVYVLALSTLEYFVLLGNLCSPYNDDLCYFALDL